MNILTICYEYPPPGGGGSPVCEGLCESLVTRGHHVDLVTVHGSDVPGYNPDRFGLAHRLIRPVWKRIVRSSRSIVTPTTYLGNLLKTLAGLLADEQRIEALRQQSLQRVREFSWERIAARYEEHYRRIYRQPHQRP